MQALIKRFVRGESGVTACGLIAAALMLIGVGAWVVATAPRVVASPQIGINPLQMMTNAGNLPTSHYDDAISSGGHVASSVESPKKQQRRVNKSQRFPNDLAAYLRIVMHDIARCCEKWWCCRVSRVNGHRNLNSQRLMCARSPLFWTEPPRFSHLAEWTKIAHSIE